MSYLEERVTFDEKIEELETLIHKNPQNPAHYNALAIVYEKMGNMEKAIALYKEAIRQDAHFIKAYNNIGVILYKQGRYDEAVEMFRLSLEADDTFVSTYVNMGAACNKAKRYEEGEEALLQAIELDDENSGAYANLGNIYNKMKRHDEARIQHEMALYLDSKSASNHANIGITYKNLGLYNGAKRALEKAIMIDPHFTNAHFDLATTYLMLGEYEKGFEAYEWRFKKPEMRAVIAQMEEVLKKPRFTLESDCENKRLFLYTEQGFGDILQFSRFVYGLKERYPTLSIMIEVREELRRLFSDMSCFDKVIVRGEERGEFDYQLATMSLPYLLSVGYEEIPKAPYIPVLGSSFLELDSQKMHIGVVWGASNTGESYADKVFSLEYFRPLMEDSRLQLYSLQVAGDSKQIAQLGLGEREIINLESSLVDFKETALVIKKLDLVITSDTSVAHLAGAMGKEVWIILQKNADWRWGIEGAHSHWYPSARLIRQERAGDWQSAFDKLYEMIEERLA